MFCFRHSGLGRVDRFIILTRRYGFMRKSELICLGIIFLSFVIGILMYPQMPEQMASHWNIAGEVDGYMPRFWGLFLMPIVSVAVLIIFVVMPMIDPMRKNIDKFRSSFDMFIIFILAFLFYLYVITLLWNTGMRFNLMQPLAPAFGVLFFVCGMLIENAKRNWSIGIRTPWTMSDEKVWTKTHKLGGKLFKGIGLIAFLGLFFPAYAIFFIMLPVILIAIFSVVYSYIEYSKTGKAQEAKSIKRQGARKKK